MSRRFALVLVLLMSVAACSDAGKKFRRSCGADAECDGGICFEQQCYEACTSKDDCAPDEICVWKEAPGREVSLCVVAADQAGCTDDAECQGMLRLSECEQTACLPESGLCAVATSPGCETTDVCGDGVCGRFETCSDCTGDCPCDGECTGGVCSTGGGGDRFTPCNAGEVQIATSEAAGLPFTTSDLPTLGVLGFVGEEGDDATVYLWLKSSPEAVETSGGNAIVLFVTLPAGSTAGGTVPIDGLGIVNGKGVIGIDGEWLQPDDELSSVTWTGASVEAGATITGTIDLTLRTLCGTGLHRPHLVTTFSVTLKSIMEIVSAQNDCLTVLTSALSFPPMAYGALEVTVDGQPVSYGVSGANVALYPESGSLSITGSAADVPSVSVQASDVVEGVQPATLNVMTSGETASCSWQRIDAEGGLTLAIPSGSLSEGPVTGTFQGTVPLVEGSDATCSPPTHTLSGSFTAAICW